MSDANQSTRQALTDAAANGHVDRRVAASVAELETRVDQLEAALTALTAELAELTAIAKLAKATK